MNRKHQKEWEEYDALKNKNEMLYDTLQEADFIKTVNIIGSYVDHVTHCHTTHCHLTQSQYLIVTKNNRQLRALAYFTVYSIG